MIHFLTCLLLLINFISTFSANGLHEDSVPAKNEHETMKAYFQKLALLKNELTLSPESAHMWGYLGMQLHVGEQKWHQGYNQEAVDCFDIAIKFTDSNDTRSLHEFHTFKGVALEHMGKSLDALNSFDVAEKYASTKYQFAIISQYKGSVYSLLQRYDEAISKYRLSLSYNAYDSVTYLGLTTALLNTECGLALKKMTLSMSPFEKKSIPTILATAESAHNLECVSDMLKLIGDIRQVLDTLDPNIQLDEDNDDEVGDMFVLEADYNEIETDKGNDDENSVEFIVKNTDMEEADVRQTEALAAGVFDNASPYHYAIFQLADALNMKRVGWKHLQLAHLCEKREKRRLKLLNKAKEDSVGEEGEELGLGLGGIVSVRDNEDYLEDMNRETDKLNRMTSYFRYGFWPPEEIGLGIKSKVPIFIIGFPRSGSTLLESMLASHPAIATIGEYSVLNGHINELFSAYFEEGLKQEAEEEARKRAEGAVSGEEEDKEIREEVEKMGVKGEETKARIIKMKQVMKPYARFTNNRANLIVKDMLEKAEAGKIHKTLNGTVTGTGAKTSSDENTLVDRLPPIHVIDKMLGNYFHLGLIHLLFPNAVILHIYRDPLDVLWSCHQRKFTSDYLSFTADPQSLVNKYMLYMRIMAHWRAHLPLPPVSRVPPNVPRVRIIDISYESLIADPEVIMRDLVVNRLGLEWDNNVLKHHSARNEDIAFTASMFQVKQQIYNNSIGSWKRYSEYLGSSGSSGSGSGSGGVTNSHNRGGTRGGTTDEAVSIKAFWRVQLNDFINEKVFPGYQSTSRGAESTFDKLSVLPDPTTYNLKDIFPSPLAAYATGVNRTRGNTMGKSGTPEGLSIVTASLDSYNWMGNVDFNYQKLLLKEKIRLRYKTIWSIDLLTNSKGNYPKVVPPFGAQSPSQSRIGGDESPPMSEETTLGMIITDLSALLSMEIEDNLPHLYSIFMKSCMSNSNNAHGNGDVMSIVDCLHASRGSSGNVQGQSDTMSDEEFYQLSSGSHAPPRDSDNVEEGQAKYVTLAIRNVNHYQHDGNSVLVSNDDSLVFVLASSHIIKLDMNHLILKMKGQSTNRNEGNKPNEDNSDRKRYMASMETVEYLFSLSLVLGRYHIVNNDPARALQSYELCHYLYVNFIHPSPSASSAVVTTYNYKQIYSVLTYHQADAHMLMSMTSRAALLFRISIDFNEQDDNFVNTIAQDSDNTNDESTSIPMSGTASSYKGYVSVLRGLDDDALLRVVKTLQSRNRKGVDTTKITDKPLMSSSGKDGASDVITFWKDLAIELWYRGNNKLTIKAPKSKGKRHKSNKAMSQFDFKYVEIAEQPLSIAIDTFIAYSTPHGVSESDKQPSKNKNVDSGSVITPLHHQYVDIYWSLFNVCDQLATLLEKREELTKRDLGAVDNDSGVDIEEFESPSLAPMTPIKTLKTFKSQLIHSKKCISLAWKFLQQAHSIDIVRLYRLASGAQRYHGGGATMAMSGESVTKSLTRETTSVMDYVLETFDKYNQYYPSTTRYGVIGNTSTVPIFIVGTYRSGSTLLETLLSSHRSIEGIGEKSVFASELLMSNEFNVIHLRNNSDVLKNRKRIKSTADAVIDKMLAKARQLRDQMNNLAHMKTGGSDSSRSSAVIRHVVDKSLVNYRNIGWIHLLFPKALVLHVYKKDPMDVLMSSYRQRFDSPALAYTQHPESLVKEYVLYNRIVHHFKHLLAPPTSSSRSAGRGSSRVSSSAGLGYQGGTSVIMDVEYEELVNNPSKVLRDIIVGRLRLPWDEKLETHYGKNLLAATTNVANVGVDGLDGINIGSTSTRNDVNDRIIYTASMFQAKQQIYNNSIGSWKRYSEHLGASSLEEDGGRGDRRCTLYTELQKYVPILKQMRIKPFIDDENEELDEYDDEYDDDE